MNQDSLLEAIKGGMKGELDSIAVYEAAAVQATGEAATFFLERAEEEKKHYNWLLSYYKDVGGGKKPQRDFAAEAAEAAAGAGAGKRAPILSEDFLKRIGQSRQLSAAVSAAALLEITAVRYYQTKAEETLLPAVKSFFENLAEWEDKHYHELTAIQEESERFYWDANNWEPF